MLTNPSFNTNLAARNSASLIERVAREGRFLFRMTVPLHPDMSDKNSRNQSTSELKSAAALNLILKTSLAAFDIVLVLFCA